MSQDRAPTNPSVLTDDVIEYWEDRYLVSNIGFGNPTGNYSRARLVELPTLEGNEMWSLVVAAPEVADLVNRHIEPAFSGRARAVRAEICFFPFEVVRLRAVVHASVETLDDLEGKVVVAIDEALPILEGIARTLVQELKLDLKPKLSFLGLPGGKLKVPQLALVDVCLYWPSFFFRDEDQRKRGDTAMKRYSRKLQSLPCSDGMSLHGAWGHLCWTGSPRTEAETRAQERRLYAIALACSEEIHYYVNNVQYFALLAQAAEGNLRGSDAHDVRRLFTTNALPLSKILLARTMITTVQRELYEASRETTGRIAEKKEQEQFLRTSLDDALAATQAKESRTASMAVTTILGFISIFGLSSMVFDTAQFLSEQPLVWTSCGRRTLIAETLGLVCLGLVIFLVGKIRRI